MTRKEASSGKRPLRLAIVSTPRSGNNWLAHLLGSVYHVPRFSPVNLPNVRWKTLPSECIIILHWRLETTLLRLLREHRFHALTIARHPLDVLVSILQFTLRESTDGWLESEAGGETGGERGILGLTPCSAGFVSYATGPRAKALLAISSGWWKSPAMPRVRYEDMVRDPRRVMENLVEQIGVPPRYSIDQAIAETSLPELRARFPDRRHHFWQAQPDLWKRVIIAEIAQQIAAAHPDAFTAEYACDPDPALTLEKADAAWRELVGLPPTGDATVAALQAALADVRRQLEITRHRLQQIEEVGPLTLSWAQRVHCWTRRFPRLAQALKRLVRR